MPRSRPTRRRARSSRPTAIPAGVLARLRALDGDTGAAVTATSTSSASVCSTASTSPSRTRSSCPTRCCARSASPSTDATSSGADVDERIAGVRAQVPEEHRDEFDELLGEARLMYRLRDERGVYSDIWASGLMRRAALAAGRRLAERGPHRTTRCTSSTPSIDEMCALVSGSRRAVGRRARRAPRTTAPRTPARTRRRSSATRRSRRPTRRACRPASAGVMRATGIALDSLFGSSEAEHEHDMLRGLAASPGVYEGPARLIAGPSEFGRIQQGDVLLTPATTEAFNILLPLLGAIVTDNGGLLSHSAIVAREYGIPGVVGTREATAAHRRRRTRARRRRRRRGHGAVRSDDLSRDGVVPLVEATRRLASTARRRSDSATPIRDGLPVPPGVALAGPVVEAVAGRGRGDDRAGAERAARAAHARSRSARRRSTRTARTRASPASTSRC